MDGDEALLVQARRQAQALSVQLADSPFERSTLEALRAYVEGNAEPAVRAWAALRRLPPAVLRQRLRKTLRGRRAL